MMKMSSGVKIAIPNGLLFDLDAPVLSAEPIKTKHGKRWRVWCEHCGVHHLHGIGEGHREAHCSDRLARIGGRGTTWRGGASAPARRSRSRLRYSKRTLGSLSALPCGVPARDSIWKAFGLCGLCALAGVPVELNRYSDRSIGQEQYLSEGLQASKRGFLQRRGPVVTFPGVSRFATRQSF